MLATVKHEIYRISRRSFSDSVYGLFQGFRGQPGQSGRPGDDGLPGMKGSYMYHQNFFYMFLFHCFTSVADRDKPCVTIHRS